MNLDEILFVSEPGDCICLKCEILISSDKKIIFINKDRLKVQDAIRTYIRRCCTYEKES